MNKRGQAEVWELNLIFEILVGLVVAAFFILSALTFNQYTKFDRIYLKEDMKMVVNTILSAPNQVKLNYSHAKIYNIKIKEDDIEVTRDLKIKNIGERHSLIVEKLSPTGVLRQNYG